MILLEIINVEIFQQLDVGNGPFAIFDVGTLVILGQRLTQIGFEDLVLLDQDAFEIHCASLGFGNGGIEIGLRNFLIGDQVIKF